MNHTKQYRFDAMSVGDSFTISDRFQHARVAASEYARRNPGIVFTCRMQPDRTMIIYRVASDQAKVDARGARGRRRIERATNDPTAQQFAEWLSAFAVGQTYTMPMVYQHLFIAMQAWCELYSIKSGRTLTGEGMPLVISRLK